MRTWVAWHTLLKSRSTSIYFGRGESGEEDHRTTGNHWTHYLLFISSIAILDFPSCVIGDQPELTAETLEIGTNLPYCWRNLFSCVNLLRILNKLTKWKHSRIMVRVANQYCPPDWWWLMMLYLASNYFFSLFFVPFMKFVDACCFQVGSNPQEDSKSEACPAAVVRPEIA